jgi:hypothetical protein
MRLNRPAIVGDIVANRTSVMRTLAMTSPRPGAPCRLSRANTDGHVPSSAAALDDWPNSSFQPPSDPTDLRIAHRAKSTMPDVPKAMRAATMLSALTLAGAAFRGAFAGSAGEPTRLTAIAPNTPGTPDAVLRCALAFELAGEADTADRLLRDYARMADVEVGATQSLWRRSGRLPRSSAGNQTLRTTFPPR